MALSDANITPAADIAAQVPTDPAPAPVSAAPAPDASAELPEAVSKNPVVVSILTGSIPGVVVRPLYYPEAYELGSKHAQDIQNLGLSFYAAQDGSTALYNPVQISEEELVAADQEGVLHQLLPDYEQLTGETPSTPPKGVEGFSGPGDLLQTAGTPATMSQGPAPQVDRDLQSKLNTARVKNVLPSGPVSGKYPVSGATTRALATPAI